MELGLGSTLLPGDPRLIDHIVAEVKSQGIFDQFRKECIADVDTKPAYQNLRTRVESSVNSFLNKQTWRPDLNKNQLRETLRKHIHDAPYLEVGVDRIVDQVVNPKVYSNFMPKIEDVVYKFLGIERPKPQRNGTCDLKDLLPTDLDPVSPESDRNSIKDEIMESISEDEKLVNGDDQKPSVSNVESKTIEPNFSPIKKEAIDTETGVTSQTIETSPVKAILNSSCKSEETNKTEEEEEESPPFEPIDGMNLNESNMSNDSHLSGISELTSHRSGSPDFATEFARDNFDCSNQDSQLSKVSSNSRLSIVTDIGSSNPPSTPKSDAKEDSKGTKDNFKAVREFNSNKDNKFNFDVAKIKENNKTSSSSKENSRDASDYKDSKTRDESKAKTSKDRHESRSSRDKDRDSRRRHSSKKRHRSKSKDKTESDSQESRDNSLKLKDSKSKEVDKKDESSNEINDLKDRYKEKIRELREKIELTEKGKLGKINQDLPKDRKDSVSKDKEESKKGTHKSSSSRSSSHHSSKSSKSSESKEARDKSSSRHDERRHSNGKGESKSSSKSRRDSKSDSRSRDRSKDKKRRDEKKSKSIDDHSSLRKNLNDRRSSDRDGSDGSSSKFSHKTSNTNAFASKLGPPSELTKDKKEQHSSGETDCVQDSLQTMVKGNDNSSKKVDPGSSEICLPLKKRRLMSEESQSDIPNKKMKSSEKKASKKKLEHSDALKNDSDVASVPDEERVQIVEYADEEYDPPYPDNELVLSLEETKKIILDGEPSPPTQPNLSEMELSIRQSLHEMMADHKMEESEDVVPNNVSTVMDSSSLLEALTDDSSKDKEANATTVDSEGTKSDSISAGTEKCELNVQESSEQSVKQVEQSNGHEKKLKDVEIEEHEEISEYNMEEEASKKTDQIIENQLEQLEDAGKQIEMKMSEVQEKTDEVSAEFENFTDIDKEKSVNEKAEESFEVTGKVDNELDTTNEDKVEQSEENEADPDESNEEDQLVIDEDVHEKENDEIDRSEVIEKLNEIGKAEENDEKTSLCDSQAKKILVDNDKDDKVQNDTENKLTGTVESVINDDVKKLNKPETSDNFTAKSSEVAEEVKDKIKNRLINELAKIDDNYSDDDKRVEEDESKEPTAAESINKISDSPTKSVDTVKMDTDDESDIDEKEDVIDENEIKAANDSEEKPVTTESEEDFELFVENSVSPVENLEHIKEDDEPSATDPISSQETKETSTEPDSLVTEEKETSATEEKDSRPSNEEPHCSTDDRVDSPIEEDCRYFDNDNEKYVSFKKYIDQLETEINQSTEENIETSAEELPPVMEPAEASTTVSTSFKRKHSPSPVAEIIVQENNNDGSTTTKESVVTEVTNQVPVEEPAIVVKKRKVGRMKKSSSSGSLSSNPQSEQPQDKEQQPQQQTQQQQQQQAPMVNGENFMMPLSPDSDISISSDKNLPGTLRDERRGQRSNQRYSSDDLYKPRPLFPSSSRRTRRYHQA